jgi:hypothetical protein
MNDETLKENIENILVSLIKQTGKVISYEKRRVGYKVRCGATNAFLDDLYEVENYVMGIKCAVENNLVKSGNRS